MKKFQKLLAGVCALTVCVASMSACADTTTNEGDSTTTADSSTAPDTGAADTEASDTEGTEADTDAADDTTSSEDTPLVVAYSPFSEKFSPFFADTSYDQDVAAMIVPGIMTTDRSSATVYNAIEGETHSYNGTDYTYTGPADISVNTDEATGETVYNIKLRDDLTCSDGTKITADDLIFTYYVLADPSYAGSSTLYSTSIKGINAYRTQISDAVNEKYAPIVEAIYAAGPDYAATEADSFTAQQAELFWDTLTQTWIDGTQAITDYVFANYGSNADYAATIGTTVEELAANDGLKVAFGMAMWGFGSYDAETGILTAGATEKTFDLANGEYPTINDYYDSTYAAYAGDGSAFASTELAGVTDSDVVADAKNAWITAASADDTELDNGPVTSIEGIKKIGDYEVEVTCEKFEANAIYQICGVSVAPLSYYGDPAQYDYENNKFGFPMGDLSIVQAKTTQPMGWGPYQFVKYENKIVYFEANPNYYKGEPKIKYMQFKETDDADKISAVATGAADISDPSGSIQAYEQISGYNSNGEATGDVISLSAVDFLGYGYIGINADTVNVAGDPDSDASKNLRKGLATILAVYRDLTIDSYYGDLAKVLNYPISDTSWAAPQRTDEDYEVAYSKDVEGNSIYTSDMTADDMYAAALEAAKDFFVAAGYTLDEATGMLTAAPEGAKLEYEAIIGADGKGDHPSFALLTAAKDAFAKIGITLTINDPSDPNVMWDKLDAGTQELFCAAWGATIDPDMYQVYHSTNVVGLGGSDSNHYHIQDETLDADIMAARTSPDQAYRKAIYKEAMDIILDWAVEIPVYQRQNTVIYSTQRVNMETTTPDLTPYWGWASEIETLEMN